MSFLADNIKALKASGQALAAAWLGAAPSRSRLELLPSLAGPPALIADGQSLCSRHDPVKEGRQWAQRPKTAQIAASGRRGLVFGAGLGYHLPPLLENPGLWGLFEADPEVARQALSQRNLAPFFAASGRRLIMVTPWHLASPRDWPPELNGAALLAHQPSKRRFPALWAAVTKRLEIRPAAGRRPFQPAFKALVAPPLYGGSLYIAQASARALVSLGLDCQMADFSALAGEIKATLARGRGLEAGQLKKAETLLLRQAEAAAPDFLLALAQAPLTAEGLNRLSRPGLKTAFWFVEDFRIFSYAEKTAPAYDYFFHIQKGLIEPCLRNWGAARGHYLPLAAEPAFFQPLAAVPETYRAVLSFMGAGYPNRRRLLARLAQDYWAGRGRSPEQFKVFGLGPCPSLARHLFQGGRRVGDQERAFIYAGGQVNLNLHSSLNPGLEIDPSGGFLNPRTFEIAAAGGFQLLDNRPLLAECFRPGEEVAVYDDYRELAAGLDYYLHHPEARAEMALKSRRRLLEEHTYEKRLAQMLEYCYN